MHQEAVLLEDQEAEEPKVAEVTLEQVDKVFLELQEAVTTSMVAEEELVVLVLHLDQVE